MDVKKEVFGKLDAICKPGAILATNTSGLNIDEIASVTKRPQDVIGLHFFSPANVMKLLEIVRGETTRQGRDRHLDEARQADRQDRGAGRRLPRASSATASSASASARRQKLVMEGAMPWDIDRVLYDFGFPMGPFAMSDLAGLDIGWDPEGEASQRRTSTSATCSASGPPRPEDRRRLLRLRREPQRQADPRHRVRRSSRTSSSRAGTTRARISDEEILERCIYPMINEGAKILEEGKAIRASTSTWSGSTATAGRSTAAARCTTATRSACKTCWPR